MFCLSRLIFRRRRGRGGTSGPEIFQPFLVAGELDARLLEDQRPDLFEIARAHVLKMHAVKFLGERGARLAHDRRGLPVLAHRAAFYLPPGDGIRDSAHVKFVRPAIFPVRALQRNGPALEQFEQSLRVHAPAIRAVGHRAALSAIGMQSILDAPVRGAENFGARLAFVARDGQIRVDVHARRIAERHMPVNVGLERAQGAQG